MDALLGVVVLGSLGLVALGMEVYWYWGRYKSRRRTWVWVRKEKLQHRR